MLYTKSILYFCKGGRADEHWGRVCRCGWKSRRASTLHRRRGTLEPGAARTRLPRHCWKMRRAAAGGSHAPGSLAGGRPRQPDSGGHSGGEDVAKHLEGCTAALLLEAWPRRGCPDPPGRWGDIAASVASDALGSALAEQAAEAAEAELRQWAARQGKYLTGRYSPLRGLPQPLLAAALDTARRAGLCARKQPDGQEHHGHSTAITRSGGIWQDAGTACSAPGANIERGDHPATNELFDRPNTILLDGGMGTMLQAAGRWGAPRS